MSLVKICNTKEEFRCFGDIKKQLALKGWKIKRDKLPLGFYGKANFYRKEIIINKMLLSNHFWVILLHEFGHFLEDKEPSDEEMLIAKHIYSCEDFKRTLKTRKIFRNIFRSELNANKKSVELIKKYNLNINTKYATKLANYAMFTLSASYFGEANALKHNVSYYINKMPAYFYNLEYYLKRNSKELKLFRKDFA